MRWLFFLFISSFEFSTSVVPSFGVVTCSWCICTPDISPVTHSLPWLCLVIICGFGFFSPSFTTFSSRLSLAILFMAPRPLCLRSFLFVMAFPPVIPPWWPPSSFLYLCTTISFPLSFFCLGVCAQLWCLPLSLLPSYLAAAFQVVLSPWLTLMQFMACLPVVMISMSVGCWVILITLTVFCLDHPFSIVSSRRSELLLLCRIPLVFFPGSLGPSVLSISLDFPLSSLLV